MTRTVHPAHWPDKVMFAAMLLVLAGLLGALFALLRLAGLTIGRDLSDMLYAMPPVASLLLSLLTVAVGLIGMRGQSIAPLWFAVGTGILSVGMLGLVPLLSLVATGFMVRSHLEGEEDARDTPLHPSMWPDKALAASLLLFAAGAVALLQALLLFRDDLRVPDSLLVAQSVLGVVSLVAGLSCLYASFEVYRLRRAWAGYVGAFLAFASAGFVLIGPVLGVASFVLLQKARSEEEFVDG